MFESPFHPGFGVVPEVLAGRTEIIDRLRNRIAATEPSHHGFLGPRGVGKTAILRDAQQWVRDTHGWPTVWHDCDSDQELSAVLAQRLLASTQHLPDVWERVTNALAKRMSISVELFVKLSMQPTSATTFHHDSILTDTFEQIGEAAREHRTKVIVFIDEIQSLEGTTELVRLSQALQSVASQRLPVHTYHAGLFLPTPPTDRGGSFLERLDITDVGDLDRDATRLAFLEPINHAGVTIHEAALDRLAEKSGGYPYFIQLYGDRTWDQWRLDGTEGPITDRHATLGLGSAQNQVDRMYRMRFDKLAPAQQNFVTAMAAVAKQGVAEIAEIAGRLGRDPKSLSQTRVALIERHQLIERAGHRGELRFTLPEFSDWAKQRGEHRVKPPGDSTAELG